MTLKEVLNAINAFAASHPLVNSVIKSGNIYEVNERPDNEYSVFCAVQQSHTLNPETNLINYNLALYYVDRLTSDGNNKIDIQSTAIQVLGNIVKQFANEYEEYADLGENINYEVFTESFNDVCAGAYATVTIQAYNDANCPDDGETRCDACYDSGYDDGYASGHTDGMAEQKAKLNNLLATKNTTYYREDGFQRVTVQVPTYKDDLRGLIEGSVGSLEIPKGTTGIRERGISNCYYLTGVTIPNSVTSIGVGAFMYDFRLKEITIPSGVSVIQDNTFFECYSLTSVTLPSSITGIGYSSFAECSGLTSIVIPNGLATIGERAFMRCTSLSSVTLPDTLVEIGNSVFSDCTSLQSISFPSGITRIGEQAFKGCTNLTDITIPTGLTVIDSQCFEGCTRLAYVTFPDTITGLTTIEPRAFRYCTNLNQIVLPSSMKSLMMNCFEGCSSLNITLNQGLEEIQQGAFKDNLQIQNFTVPDSVTSISLRAFEGCINMTTLTMLPTTPPTLTNYSGYNWPENLQAILVPSESYDAYYNATGWKRYRNLLERM